MEISVQEEAESDELLSLVINFKKQVLFDMSTYSVKPLTCSFLDMHWSMNLPEVFEPQNQTVKIEMQKDQAQNLFVLS